MNKKVAVIIPTFNRKILLLECLVSLTKQTYKPLTVFICDNKSTDGTMRYLSDNGFLNSVVNGIAYKYLQMPINGGGAMGFSIGMKMAYNENIYDAFWMMDDDGIPAYNCLEILLEYIDRYNYVSPIVMNKENKRELVAPVLGSTDPRILKTVYRNNMVLKGYCNPFNGGLYSKKIVDIVGFPKQELFIYGDEMNYYQRCIDAGYLPVGIYEAIHYHPRFKTDNLISFGHVVAFRPIELTMYCQWRNSIYNKKIRFKKNPFVTIFKILGYLFMHTIFFILKKPSFKWLCLFYKASFAGLFDLWGGQYKYIK